MQSLHVEQLQDFVAAHPGVLLLDVREPWEVQRARIDLPGATSLHMPLQQIPARLAELTMLLRRSVPPSTGRSKAGTLRSLVRLTKASA